MEKNRRTYNLLNLASAVFMILALLWLTVSIPFVTASQQQLAKIEKSQSLPSCHTNDEEATNPFGNNTEEKAPSNSTVSEEYLHDHNHAENFLSVISQFYKCENSGIYNAFHGEVQVPPPNVA